MIRVVASLLACCALARANTPAPRPGNLDDSARPVSILMSEIRSNLYVDPATIYGEPARRSLAPAAAAPVVGPPGDGGAPPLDVAPPRLAAGGVSVPDLRADARPGLARDAKQTALSLLLYVPRLLVNVVRQIVAGEVSHSLQQTIQMIAYTLDIASGESAERAGFALGDSVFNILSLVEGLLSDVVSAMKWVFYSWAPTAPRVEVCTGNLSSGMTRKLAAHHFVNPAKHVAVLIDGTFETEDPKSNAILTRAKERGGITCQPAPILSGEPEWIAIERLACTHRHYEPEAKYDFLAYNCGGYTRDILDWSGLGYPTGANWGIGSEIVTGEAAEWAGKKRPEIIAKCDEHIRRVQTALAALETGAPVDSDTRQYFGSKVSIFSGDVWLRFHAAAARGRDATNREWVRKQVALWARVSLDGYRVDGGKSPVKESLKETVSRIFAGIDDEAGAWIDRAEPPVGALYKAVKE